MFTSGSRMCNLPSSDLLVEYGGLFDKNVILSVARIPVHIVLYDLVHALITYSTANASKIKHSTKPI